MVEPIPQELLDHMRSHVTTHEDDGSDFDDLDDDELSNYIATEKEVCVSVPVYVYVLIIFLTV